MKKYSKYLIVLLAFIFGFLGAHVESIVSASGEDTNVIHACVNNQTGDVRIVDANTTCNPAYYPIEWNIQGQSTGNQLPFICGDCRFNSDFIMDRFAGMDLSEAIIYNGFFDGHSFAGTNFTNATIQGSSFRNDNLSGANFLNAYIYANSFLASNLSNAIFENTTIYGGAFDNSNVNNVNFRNAVLNYVSFRGSDLTGSDFTGADVALTCVWSNAICPDGTNSDRNGGTCIGHLLLP